MSGSRIDQAIARIDSALARIDAAQATIVSSTPPAEDNDSANSARVMALVNTHEKLREEVADTLGELDKVIAELEE